MKRQVSLLLVLVMLLAVCTACGGSQATADSSASVNSSVSAADGAGGEGADADEVEAALEQFLTSVYTTDDQGRYTAYLAGMEALDSAVSSAEGSAAYEEFPAEVTEAYYAGISPLVTEDLYTKLVQNRVPFKYDKQYADTPAVVQDVTLTAQEGGYSYAVTLQIGGETETRSGELQWTEQDGSILVSYFYEAD
ncbi:MAG: hypothetical protein LUH45_07100 [Clostridiales bacterium]|nr:hypothetical protein [Clostridiales bacterium]